MKSVLWIGSTKDDVNNFPLDVKKEVGFTLYMAQQELEAVNVTPLLGFNGTKVREIICNSRNGTFRTVFTVQFGDFVYVLHAFQKKSKAGIATPQKEIKLIKSRLKVAQKHYEDSIEKIAVLEKKNVRSE